MPLTLIVETGAGLSNANAFASRATVTTALEASPFASAWVSVALATQDQCIAESTAWLSRMPWDGVRTVMTQALAFPRSWLYNVDGYTVASSPLPPWLMEATARLAFWLSQQGGTSPFEGNGLQEGTPLSLPGGLQLTPSSGAKMPSDVVQLIRPYLSGGGSSLVRA